MKNAEIVKALPNLKMLKHEHEALKRQIKNLLKQEQQLQREITVLDRVTEVYEGVALWCEERPTIYGRDFNAHAADDSIGRWAEVYANAHNKGADYGLKFRESARSGPGTGREDWAGTGWAWADAVYWARQYVAHGHKPSKQVADMCQTRHALDPKGEAPKRRRLAFEAAYEAGHIELAKELLLGKAKLDKRVAQLAREHAKEAASKEQANV